MPATSVHHSTAVLRAVCGPLPGRYLRIAVSLSVTSCRSSITSVLAASAAALFTKKQVKRIASGRRHVDLSGITADKMLDYYESQDSAGDRALTTAFTCTASLLTSTWGARTLIP